MPWNIQYTKQAERQLNKLSPVVENRVAKLETPKLIAKKLSGPYEDRIRYRVGDYRVICRIVDHLLLILMVEVAHRREVYR